MFCGFNSIFYEINFKITWFILQMSFYRLLLDHVHVINLVVDILDIRISNKSEYVPATLYYYYHLSIEQSSYLDRPLWGQ